LWCRGRDSNPHGGCPPENFKSFDYSEKVFVLLALFPTNVKVCKYSKIANNIAHLQLCRSEAFSPHIYLRGAHSRGLTPRTLRATVAADHPAPDSMSTLFLN
jgi:hypothetical protein